MRISNFGMGVLHVKVKYWRIVCDVISLLAQVFILSSNRVSKEVSMKKKWKFFYVSVFVIWLYFQKARYRPCDLDLWPMKVNLFSWIEYNHISILYKFQIDISSNSREIKYQNIGRTHRYTHTHTHRHTDTHTDRPGENNTSQPLRGRGNNSVMNSNVGTKTTTSLYPRNLCFWLHRRRTPTLVRAITLSQIHQSNSYSP